MSDLSHFIVRNEGDPSVSIDGMNGIHQRFTRETQKPFFVRGEYSVRILDKVILSIKTLCRSIEALPLKMERM